MSSILQGYKQTDIGVIPEDWEVKRLGDLTTSTTGGTPSTNVLEYWGGSIPWMSSGDLHLKQIYDVNGRITQIGLENSSAHIIPKNCVLIGLAGQGKTRGTAAINRIPLCTNQSIGAILPKNTFSSDYLFYAIDSIYEQLRSLSSGEGGRGGLNLNILNHIVVPLPNFTEQKAIAEVLSDMDALIEAQKELIAKKRDIKQGTMQDLLSGRVRLPGYETKSWKHTDIGDIPDDWEVKSFSNIAYLIKETVDPTSNKSLNCVELEHLSSSTGLLIDFDDLSNKSSFKNKFQRGDVLFGKLRSYLRKFWLCQWSGCCSTEIWVFRPKSITNSVFLKYIVSSDQFVKVASESFGTHMPRADWNVVKECFFAIPALYSEQQAIAQVLSDMDDELETLEVELEKLNHMKRGMMQELLTGRIRLI